MNLKGFLNFINNDFRRKVDAILEDYNKKLPEEVRPFIEKNLWMRRHPNYPKRYINTTDKLFIRTGTLTNALRVNNLGNISRIARTDSTYSVDYGIDVSKVPYALFHETGTSRMRARPYLTPGIAEFRQKRLNVIQAGILRKLKNLWDRTF